MVIYQSLFLFLVEVVIHLVAQIVGHDVE